MNIVVNKIDYMDAQAAADLKMLLNEYAKDPMGGGGPIDPAVLDQLPQSLHEMPTAFTLIAYVDGVPAGICNCFFGFSTFAVKPLINIHDFAVAPAFRGMGISRKLMNEVERLGREKGCCKVTLEILSNNVVAMKAYERFGFEGYSLSPDVGHALFWQKKLLY